NGGTASTVIDIAATAPGIFTATMDDKGDQVYLVLYGTGLRHAGSVSVSLNGTNLPVVFFGPQGEYPGLDQINVGPLPAGLAGTSLANLVVRADDRAANPVTLSLKP